MKRLSQVQLRRYLEAYRAACSRWTIKPTFVRQIIAFDEHARVLPSGQYVYQDYFKLLCLVDSYSAGDDTKNPAEKLFLQLFNALDVLRYKGDNRFFYMYDVLDSAGLMGEEVFNELLQSNLWVIEDIHFIKNTSKQPQHEAYSLLSRCLYSTNTNARVWNSPFYRAVSRYGLFNLLSLAREIAEVADDMAIWECILSWMNSSHFNERFHFVIDLLAALGPITVTRLNFFMELSSLMGLYTLSDIAGVSWGHLADITYEDVWSGLEQQLKDNKRDIFSKFSFLKDLNFILPLLVETHALTLQNIVFLRSLLKNIDYTSVLSVWNMLYPLGDCHDLLDEHSVQQLLLKHFEHLREVITFLQEKQCFNKKNFYLLAQWVLKTVSYKNLGISMTHITHDIHDVEQGLLGYHYTVAQAIRQQFATTSPTKRARGIDHDAEFYTTMICTGNYSDACCNLYHHLVVVGEQSRAVARHTAPGEHHRFTNLPNELIVNLNAILNNGLVYALGNRLDASMEKMLREIGALLIKNTHYLTAMIQSDEDNIVFLAWRAYAPYLLPTLREWGFNAWYEQTAEFIYHVRHKIDSKKLQQVVSKQEWDFMQNTLFPELEETESINQAYPLVTFQTLTHQVIHIVTDHHFNDLKKRYCFWQQQAKDIPVQAREGLRTNFSII